jgi:hypothetical protein
MIALHCEYDQNLGELFSLNFITFYSSLVELPIEREIQIM